jgi:hypothetical protein
MKGVAESTMPELRPESTKDKLLAERSVLEKEAFRVITFYEKARLQLGRIFIRLKATLRHGEWEQYFEETFADACVSFRSAERYMKLAAKAEADSKTDSLSILKPGMDQHAVAIHAATERAKRAVGDAPNPELVYRLALHLSADQREATIKLWISKHRPSAERDVIAVLDRLHLKYGVLTQTSLSRRKNR